ncbi:MAG: LuxR C-terminal-related transcriptional regulator [Treponema sp.]|nr:LuxR C-terminal-related transcriptional regulator [Treponema sp.]
MQQEIQNLNIVFHFKRNRLNQLFTEAMKYPVIVVCAGAGYGKTTAVHDFVQEYKATTVWVQLSERDNVGGRFWENFTHSMTLINNAPFATSVKKLGFPDTQEKLKQYQNLLRDHGDKKRRVIVFDDCHYIENSAVIRFVEEAIRGLPVGTTLFMISRSTPRINIASLVSSDRIYNFSENELRFTESEISQYFRGHNISLQPDSLRGITQDTEGWAFAVNLIARSYSKAPGYEGYLRNAMKSNIFRYMEIEIWNIISERLKNFLVRLSLIDHLSVELIALLAGDDTELMADLEKQNAYVRRDSYINAYLIHPLFLEFLTTKQDLLSQEEKITTYSIAGEWCKRNSFKIDALSYYEKIGDYRSIVWMFIGSASQIPYDIACYTAAILERTPIEVFDKVEYLASTHMRSIMCQGKWEEAEKLAEFYESRYIKLPEDDLFRRQSLSSIYYCWGITRSSLGLINDVYDFDLYFEKVSKCYKEPVNSGKLISFATGPWVCSVGSSRKGAMQEFLSANSRTRMHLSKCFLNYNGETDDLASGELKFYQGDIQGSEALINRTLNYARDKKRSSTANRVLFYTLRIAIAQGNFLKAQKTLKEQNALLDDEDYYYRFVEYDITACWFFSTMGLLENVPEWLKENFSLYAHTSFIENYGNQMKARYCYASRNYPPLLSYIQDMKERESYLFGRIEMLAIEACIYYKMKDREKAYKTLEEAYNAASPNEILMPFIEMGKDMRTLTAYALKETDGSIPKSWLEGVNLKSASYAKRLAHVATEYKRANNISDDIAISQRESEILTDLSHGLSRTEIADSRQLSINTVKMVINNLYMKLGAENLAEAIRIAAERKIV